MLDTDSLPASERAALERNEVRARATHERILGEAANGCRRVRTGSAATYVSPAAQLVLPEARASYGTVVWTRA